METKHVKILFRFFSDILDEETIETMWATVLNEEKGTYQIANIPFYAFVACGDIIFAEYDEDEKMLTYRKTVKYSGNSTIHIILLTEEFNANELFTPLQALKCNYEGLNTKYFALGVPKVISYKPVKDILKVLEQKELLSYSESCLSDKHWNDVYST